LPQQAQFENGIPEIENNVIPQRATDG